uniref:Uncharacterized protein n=1 Tax=Caenorhabditis japonica TaxID=281687 RepID=A0A8R1DNQ5_CAEJA
MDAAPPILDDWHYAGDNLEMKRDEFCRSPSMPILEKIDENLPIFPPEIIGMENSDNALEPMKRKLQRNPLKTAAKKFKPSCHNELNGEVLENQDPSQNEETQKILHTICQPSSPIKSKKRKSKVLSTFDSENVSEEMLHIKKIKRKSKKMKPSSSNEDGGLIEEAEPNSAAGVQQSSNQPVRVDFQTFLLHIDLSPLFAESQQEFLVHEIQKFKLEQRFERFNLLSSHLEDKEQTVSTKNGTQEEPKQFPSSIPPLPMKPYKL